MIFSDCDIKIYFVNNIQLISKPIINFSIFGIFKDVWTNTIYFPAGIKNIDVSNTNIKSLKGMENVENLNISGCNYLEDYDLSYSKVHGGEECTKVEYGGGGYHGYKCIDAIINNPNNVLLKKLKSIDISNTKSIDIIFKYLPTGLCSLDMHNNQYMHLVWNNEDDSNDNSNDNSDDISDDDEYYNDSDNDKTFYLNEYVKCCTFITKHNFPNLTELNISECKHIDICVLKNLPKLKKLYADNTLIYGDDLSRLVNLEELSVVSCYNISDNSIMNLTKLKYLNVSSDKSDEQLMKITDNGIKDMINLETLIASGSKINGSSFKYLINLKTLDIRGCVFIDADNLNDLKQITKLNVCGVDLKDYQFDNMKKMRVLSVLGLSLSNCEFPELHTLDISFSDINDDTISKFKNLSKLKITYCSKLTENKLKKITKLRQLTMKPNIVGNVDFMDNLIKLKIPIESTLVNELKQLKNYSWNIAKSPNNIIFKKI